MTDAGDPTQRVIVSAVFCTLFGSLIRAYYTPCMSIAGHAHLVMGGSNAIEGVRTYLAREGIAVEANPDLYQKTFSYFGVDDAREIADRASTKALHGRRIFIVAAASMTSEAQNALLKTIEEPVEGTLFFLITPAPHMLLPTLRSRMQLLSVEAETDHHAIDAELFLAASPAKRIDMLSPLLEKGEDERRDIAGILMFLSSLECLLEKEPQSGRTGIEAVYRARKYAGDKGSLLKPLLEQVALLVQ